MNRRDCLRLLLSTPAFAVPMHLRAQDKRYKRVVLVELAGANDGLNTLIPVADDNYQRLRPTIALPASQRISINSNFAFHQSLAPLMPLWESGHVAWVQGLGYPAANRSHFKSIALWETGSDGTKQRRSGWLTHDIEHRLGRQPVDPHGISLVENLDVFASSGGRWLSMTSPEQFTALALKNVANATELNSSVALVKNQIAQLEQSLHGIAVKMNNSSGAGSIGGGELGSQLEQVARMIRAGLDTPVFRVQHSGFDTHEYQQYRHSRLLEQLAQALSGFSRQLKADGEWNNTIIMTYSEFGRRAAENQSAGTDHGTAAPHLVMGGAVRGGLYGTAPSLEGIGSHNDPQFTMDYRALYAAVLDQWFAIDNHTFEHHHHNALDKLFS
ncbi:MAG: DUF1501 domain-containing protein [Pseudomonadota bacterium]